VVSEWSRLVDIIHRHELKFSQTAIFREECTEIENRLFELAEEEVGGGVEFDEFTAYDTEALRIESLAESIGILDRDESREELIDSLLGMSEEYNQYGSEAEEQRYDADLDRSLPEKDFDVVAMFEDL
jgi:hypothetical protein